MDCNIDCKTLICERCKKNAHSCNIARNCIIQDKKTKPKIIKKPKTKITTNRTGTELKKLLSRIGIHANSGCSCSDRAKHMDYMEQKEPGWTERNIDEIVAWMQEEAHKRKLPFIRIAAKTLVRLAIRNAKKQ